MRYAIESAIFAAKAITESLNYDTLWKNAFEKDLLGAFKRRLLLERMSNEDYEKLILDNNVSIKNYEKIPPIFKKMVETIKFSNALKEWRKKYSITKIFQ